jgi:hypothetical protein
MSTPPDRAMVVRLYEVDQLSYRQIARRVGTSYGTVQRIIATDSTPRPSGNRPKPPPPCGTKAAYQRHQLAGEDPDEACEQANRDYTREFDQATGYSRARNRAYRQLAGRHPDIFAALLAEEDELVRGEAGTRQVRRVRARERALRRLARRYPAEYDGLFAAEMAGPP